MTLLICFKVLLTETLRLSAVNPICGNQKVVAPIVMTVDGKEYEGSMTVGLATSSGRKLDAPDVQQEACPMSGIWGIWVRTHGFNLPDGQPPTLTSMHLLLGHLQDGKVRIHPGKSLRFCVSLLHTALTPPKSADPQITGTCTLGAIKGGLSMTGKYYDGFEDEFGFFCLHVTLFVFYL